MWFLSLWVRRTLIESMNELAHPGNLTADGVGQAASETQVEASKDAQVEGLPPAHKNQAEFNGGTTARCNFQTREGLTSRVPGRQQHKYYIDKSTASHTM